MQDLAGEFSYDPSVEVSKTSLKIKYLFSGYVRYDTILLEPTFIRVQIFLLVKELSLDISITHH